MRALYGNCSLCHTIDEVKIMIYKNIKGVPDFSSDEYEERKREYVF